MFTAAVWYGDHQREAKAPRPNPPNPLHQPTFSWSMQNPSHALIDYGVPVSPEAWGQTLFPFCLLNKKKGNYEFECFLFMSLQIRVTGPKGDCFNDRTAQSEIKHDQYFWHSAYFPAVENAKIFPLIWLRHPDVINTGDVFMFLMRQREQN